MTFLLHGENGKVHSYEEFERSSEKFAIEYAKDYEKLFNQNVSIYKVIDEIGEIEKIYNSKGEIK